EIFDDACSCRPQLTVRSDIQSFLLLSGRSGYRRDRQDSRLRQATAIDEGAILPDGGDATDVGDVDQRIGAQYQQVGAFADLDRPEVVETARRHGAVARGGDER